jgi:magnesium chelatase accessory protein
VEHASDSWPNDRCSRFVEAGGILWHVQQMGTGPAVVLVHGTGASTHSWRDLMPILAHRFCVIAMDLPGHGFSEMLEPKESSIAGVSRALAALLRVLEVDPRYCVGHSAGAVVSCRMALDGFVHPDLIISLNGAFLPLGGRASQLLSPVARLLGSNKLMGSLIARRTTANPASVGRLVASTGSKLDDAGIELYARLLRNPRHVTGALRMMGNWDLAEFGRDMPRLTVPLILVVGDHDRMVPPQQALQVQEMLPDAQITWLPGLGHLAHEENPQLLADCLLSSFARQSKS